MKYGIQLYSIRDAAEKDLGAAMEFAAELGYDSVEPAGFFGHTAAEVKEMLSENHLKLSGTHSSFDDLLNNFDETVAFHKVIGNKNYIIPGYSLKNQEEIDFFVEKVNPLQKRLVDEGINLSYHNHAVEFKMNEDGSVPMEQLLYRTSLSLEVDTYWAFVGMGRPVALLNRIRDRIRFVHIKDGTVDGHGMPLGMGEAPVSEVIAEADRLDIPMVVESETCSPDGPTEIKICINYLHSLV